MHHDDTKDGAKEKAWGRLALCLQEAARPKPEVNHKDTKFTKEVDQGSRVESFGFVPADPFSYLRALRVFVVQSFQLRRSLASLATRSEKPEVNHKDTKFTKEVDQGSRVESFGFVPADPFSYLRALCVFVVQSFQLRRSLASLATRSEKPEVNHKDTKFTKEVDQGSRVESFGFVPADPFSYLRALCVFVVQSFQLRRSLASLATRSEKPEVNHEDTKVTKEVGRGPRVKSFGFVLANSASLPSCPLCLCGSQFLAESSLASLPTRSEKLEVNHKDTKFTKDADKRSGGIVRLRPRKLSFFTFVLFVSLWFE